MGHATVERRQQLLHLRLSGTLSPDEMRAFVEAHNRAVDAYAGGPYWVFCDIRELRTLSPESAGLFEEAKRHSAAQEAFRGSAVLADSTLVAMQHERTSVTSGVMATEHIGTDEAACLAHLERLGCPRHALT